MIPFDLKMTLEKALKQSPELKQAYETEEVTRELIDTALDPGRPHPQRLGSRRRRRHRRPAAGEPPAAQAGRGRRHRHPVRHGAGRRPRPAEDGLPRPQDAHGHPQHLRDGAADARHRGADRPPAARRRQDLRPAQQGEHARRVPAWNPAACAICAASSRSAPSSTSRRSLRSTGPGRWS